MFIFGGGSLLGWPSFFFARHLCFTDFRGCRWLLPFPEHDLVLVPKIVANRSTHSLPEGHKAYNLVRAVLVGWSSNTW